MLLCDRVCRVFLTILSLLPCAAADGEKLVLRSGFPFADVWINGHGPFRMLIDTGTSSSLLSPEAAEAAGLVFDHRVVMATLTGEKVIPAAPDNRVRLGETSASGVEILVTEMREVQRLDSKAQGLLGQSFFRQFAYLIDYRKKRLWLGPEATEQASRLPIAIPATKAGLRTILPVRLERGGRLWRLTLDSGASHLVVDCAEDCPPGFEVWDGSRLATHLGERPVSRVTVRYVEVGGQRMPAAEAVLLDASAPDRPEDGVLPANWFSAVYVDSEIVRVAR